MKSIAAASVVALTALSSHAASTDWGQHDLLESALGLTAGGVIFDTFSFSLAVQSDVASSVSSLGAVGAGTYSLFAVGADGVLGTADDIGFGAWNFGGAPTVHTVSLAAGNYYYAVFGLASGAAAYSINSAAAAAPVPEPETYALLGAGLGVIGFVVSRRRREA
ncbi:FxDxF family PEP-CTERM protein [Roseateles sp.]|uniref:FxDxF family PEP-CTERM protein n=1 Tax=Roseateles sp. TaxID=1971397 RepID=UPI0025DF00B4|nr:FxDxF family PEP-CTERM protein [Roseateles sp.]